MVRALNQPNSFSNQPNSWIGRSIGDRDRYRLDERLGGGGMGEVFLATDTRLGKPVAVKLLKESLAIAEDLDLKERFERECAICAALKSQHIVQVSDYGLTPEGYPFYVMEYLQGQTLGELLSDQPRLSVAHTRNIMTQVCAGLQLAHEGVVIWNRETNSSERIKVVHRDLKPANIFLVPTALGELVKIIDFGIAKIHSLQAEYTSVTSVFLGTCHYAPPEQFDIRGEVNERSDIYSLGVILYEMLTGTDPFGFNSSPRKITNNAWLAAHASKPPLPLRSQPHCDHIPPALEAVVLRCLEKSPNNRFASVTELSKALQTASLDASTIVRPAKPDSAKETRRDNDAVTQHQSRLETRKQAPAPAPTSPRPPLSPSPRPPVPPPTVPQQQASRRVPWIVIGSGVLLAVAIGAYLAPEWLPLPSPIPRLSGTQQFSLAETLSGSSSAVTAALLSPDGQTLISGGEDQDATGQFYPIKIWDMPTKQVRRSLDGHLNPIQSLSLSENGQILASGSEDHTIKIWDMATGTLRQTLEGHTAPVWSVALSPDGQTLISGSDDQTVRIWDLPTGESRILSEHTATVYSVALSPDGKTIASSGEDKTIRLWDLETGELIRTIGEPGAHTETIRAVAFSPDGQQLASASWDDRVKLWSATTGQLLQTFEGHSDQVVSVTFIHDQAIASASLDNTIKIWDTQTGQATQTIPAHSRGVLSVTSHTADQTLVSSSSDTTIKIWR
jgi:WD40 repeat protein/tRNA A-37 threonylcarbamoyl transferase component Bud32